MPVALTSTQIMLLASAVAAGLLLFALRSLPSKTTPPTPISIMLIGVATAGALIYAMPWAGQLTPRLVALFFMLGLLGALTGARLVRPPLRRAFTPPLNVRVDFTVWACAVLFGLFVEQGSDPNWYTAAAVILLIALGGVVGSNLLVVLVAAGVSPQLFLGPLTGAPLPPSPAPATQTGTPESLHSPPAPQAGAPPRPAASFCTACGAPLVPGAKFCTSCGAPAADASAAPQ